MRALLVKMTLLIVAAAALRAPAQVRDSPYPRMAPIDQYLMAPDAEIAMARSAAPESLSRDAEVMVLGRQGYQTAVKGKSGFVCMVEGRGLPKSTIRSSGIPGCALPSA
jgi:hypothetical protein